MPFDAGVMAAVVKQLEIQAVGARIDKIYQPDRDEVMLGLRVQNGNKRLLLSACAGNSRAGFCNSERENPATPPMFCMLLRKHLSGGHILSVKQIGFDRALEMKIGATDDMGFATERYLICEIMGTYSNVIFLDENRRILSVIHPVSLSASNKRQVLCGFEYEDPPKQEGKINALDVTEEIFAERCKNALDFGNAPAADKFLIANFAGLSPLIAREITYRASGNTSTPLGNVDIQRLWFNFSKIYTDVKNGVFSPCLIKNTDGKVMDFSFCEIRQYATLAVTKPYDDISELLDVFYSERDKNEHIKRRGQDVLRLLANAESRIKKKTALQRESLAECENRGTWKKYADLITANMYALKKGMKSAELIDYEDENMPTVSVPLDERLTPSQNAQKYYKKYAKAKSALVMLNEQIEESARELSYIDTVFESLAKAENENDFAQIRTELSMTGYGRKLENMRKSGNKSKKDYRQNMKKDYKPMRFMTSGGYEVLCGKNNLQNDYVTTVLASKDDYWFHVKNAPGSHVVMRCGKDEPDAKDFTECAKIAVLYSSQKETPNAAVDYTRVRHVKKPSGSKPGFVVYDTNFTAFATADKDLADTLRRS